MRSKIFVLILIVATSIATADDAPLYLNRSVRIAGMGNAFEAIADDLNAIHFNPAGLSQIDKFQLQVLSLRGNLTHDLADELSTINDFFTETIMPLTKSSDPLSDPNLADQRQQLVDRATNLLTKNIRVGGDLPLLSLAIPILDQKATIGVSLYGQTISSVRIRKQGLPWTDPIIEMLDNEVIYNVMIQTSAASAFSYRFDLKKSFLDQILVGTGFRLIWRGEFTDRDDPFQIIDVLNRDEFQKKYFDLGDSSLSSYARENLDTKVGYSIDLGTIIKPIDGFNVALAVRNLASSIGDDSIPRNVIFSMSAKPFDLMEKKNEWIDLTFAMSFDQINGDDALGNFALDQFTDNLHLGVEARIMPDQWLEIDLRAGDNQGFPTFGIGVNVLKFMRIDFARYANVEADWWVVGSEFVF